MFKKPSPNDLGLEKAIDDVLTQLPLYPANSEEYAAMVTQLAQLHAMKVAQTPPGVSKDVIVTVVANLVGIAVIVGHERTHIVTSKALTFVKKLL